MRIFVLARHGQSQLNANGIINGDPSRPGPLTERGRKEAALLGAQLRELPLDLCVHTRFQRTLETAAIALAGRDVPLRVEPLLDDIDVGELEGQSVDDYRAWKSRHARSEPFPGGESLDDAARRYARGLEALVEGTGRAVLAVCHEIPVRFALNAAAGSDDLDEPTHAVANATPYLFTEQTLLLAAGRLEALSRR